VGDTARHGHGHGKDTPSFEVGETARQFGIVIPLSYLCIVDGMARKKDTGTSKARQGGVVTTPRHGKTIWNCKLPQPNRYEISRQGKSVHNLEMHDLQFGIVIPL
jgi:hypothetical protein